MSRPANPLAVVGQVVTLSPTYADRALAILGNGSADSNLDSDDDGMNNGAENIFDKSRRRRLTTGNRIRGASA